LAGSPSHCRVDDEILAGLTDDAPTSATIISPKTGPGRQPVRLPTPATDGIVYHRVSMANSLRSALDDLARKFASSVVDAIRGASLGELLIEGGGARRGAGRPRGTTTAASTAARASAPARKPGRLPRRSPEDIARALDKIVLLVKTHKNGMRAEEIRATLGMQAKEMPRVLREGLAKKKLKAKGQKRATVYSATA
jgi:hypothetical protein